jgi:hypothetical protein
LGETPALAPTLALSPADRARAYRASLTEEKKAEVRVRDAQRKQRKRMENSLKRIALRVASTDFTQQEEEQEEEQRLVL